MKTKIFTGTASEVEADSSNFIASVESFQLHSQSVASLQNGSIALVIFYLGNEPEKKSKK